MYEDTAEIPLVRYNRSRRAPLGTRAQTPKGYWRVRTGNGWEYEHHLIAAQILGRPLEAGERVAWADGDHTNNDPANLVINQPVPLGEAAPAHRVRTHRNPAKPWPKRQRFYLDPGPELHEAIVLEAQACGMAPATWLAALAADELGLTRPNP